MDSEQYTAQYIKSLITFLLVIKKQPFVRMRKVFNNKLTSMYLWCTLQVEFACPACIIPYVLGFADLENWNGTDRHHFNAIVSDQDLVEVGSETLHTYTSICMCCSTHTCMHTCMLVAKGPSTLSLVCSFADVLPGLWDVCGERFGGQRHVQLQLSQWSAQLRQWPHPQQRHAEAVGIPRIRCECLTPFPATNFSNWGQILFFNTD